MCGGESLTKKIVNLCIIIILLTNISIGISYYRVIIENKTEKDLSTKGLLASGSEVFENIEILENILDNKNSSLMDNFQLEGENCSNKTTFKGVYELQDYGTY